MDVEIFTDGKTTVKHVTENGKHVVRIENSKNDNAVFYRGDSINRAKKMFLDLINFIKLLKNQE